MLTHSETLEKATLAAGCFWCTEAIFKRLIGVNTVISGYTGGSMENPSYERVSMGTTGHAEAIQITFDPTIIPYRKLLEIFFHTHNPTTKNQQGADIGTQYRSIIFYHTDTQKKTAEALRDKLDAANTFSAKIVTEIVPFESFFAAEEYHQNYYNKNEGAPYCSIVIDPKLQKLLREFGDNVKDEYAH